MKYFPKTVNPYCFYKILIQIFPLILGHLLFLNKRYEIPLTHSIWCDAFHSLILSREGLILILSHFPCPEGWISCSIPVDGC